MTTVIEGHDFTFKCKKHRVRARLEFIDDDLALLVLRFLSRPEAPRAQAKEP
jgi:hypothetical protein